MSDTTKTITQSAKRFFSGTLISRFTGMFRDMAMAYAFGTQDAIAAFMVAFRFSHLFRRLLGEGALQTAFIPHFEEIRAKDSKKAFSFFRDLTFTLSLLLVVIVILSICGMSYLFNTEALSAGNREILFLTILMMPSLLFICLFGLNASLLQCEKSYFTPSVAPVAFNLIWIAAVFLIWYTQLAASMSWLAIAVIAACLFQWLMTIPQIGKILRANLKQNLWKNINLRSVELRSLLIPLGCGMMGVAASQINNALDSLFARYADLEGPAFLWYSIRLQQLPLALFGVAISGAILPPLSRAIKNQDISSYQHFLQFAVRRGINLMLPMTFGLLILGDACINIIYGHGDFNAMSVTRTTQSLWAYGIGLIPMTLVLIFAPAFYAMKNYKIPTIASLLAVMLNIGLNAFLVMILGLGAASVALATSASSLLNFAVLFFYLKKEMGAFAAKSLYISLLKTLFACCLASFAVLISRIFLWDDLTLWQISHHLPATLSRHFIDQVIFLGFHSIIFWGSFLLVGWICKADDLPLPRLFSPNQT